MIWGIEQKLEIITVSQLFFWHLMIYNYFEFKSKDILYDEKNIYIRNGPYDFIELPFDRIIKIKRFYFYFYQITYKEHLMDHENRVYYVIPDPHTFFRQKELLEISRYAKKNW